MADLAPRTTIPTDFAAIDADSYALGSPTHAQLGRALARSDRWLLAHLRRHHAQAWPQGQVTGGALTSECAAPPLTGRNRVSTLWWVPTPLVTQGEWYVRATLPAAATARAVPFVIPGQPIRAARDGDYVLTGTGNPETYGPIPVSMQNLPAGVWIGLVIECDVTVDATVVRAAAERVLPDYVRSTGVEFDPAGLGVPPLRAQVRIFRYEGLNQQFFGPWRRILAVSDDGSEAWTVPGLVTDYAAYGTLADLWFELQALGTSEVHGVSFFELPRAGRLT